MEEDPKSGGQKKTRTTSFSVFLFTFFSLLVMYATSVILPTMFIEVVLLYTTHMNATGCGIDLKTDNPKLLTKTMKNTFTVCLATQKSLALDY